MLQSGCESECGETPTEASEHTRTQTQTHTGFSRPVSNLVRQRRTTRGRVRVSGSVEEENVLGLKLKPCAPKAYHTGFSRSHWFYLKVAGPRTCAPKAYHEGQSEGVSGSVEEENVLKLKPCAPKAYHTGFSRSNWLFHTDSSHSIFAINNSYLKIMAKL